MRHEGNERQRGESGRASERNFSLPSSLTYNGYNGMTGEGREGGREEVGEELLVKRVVMVVFVASRRET